MSSAPKDFQTSELDTVRNVMSLNPADPLNTFAEMWYQVFLWALFSSIFVHVIAAAIAFATLRKHKFGKCSVETLLLILTTSSNVRTYPNHLVMFPVKLVFSHFHPCDGRLVSIDIRCGKQRSSGFCVQSFQFADGTTVCIVLGSGADILGRVHRFHSDTCHFITLLELNEQLLKQNINSQFSRITCRFLLPHFIIFSTEMHPEKVGMTVNIHVDTHSHVFRMDTVYIKCISFFLFQFPCVNTVLLSSPVSPKLVDSSLSDFNPFTACMTVCHDPAILKCSGLSTLSQFLATVKGTRLYTGIF